MALTPSGAISLGDINTALNRSATASISINDTQVRYLANQDSGSVNMNAMRDKQSTVGTITVGVFDDGISRSVGFETGFFGSLSANTFFGGTLTVLFTDVLGVPNPTRMGGTATGIPSIAARLTVNGVSVDMARWTTSFYTSSDAAARQFADAMIGGTYTFQFAQK